MITKHQQLFRHDPDNGVYGDCYRTVIACLLNVPVIDVPHFCPGPPDSLASSRVREFLSPKGMMALEICFSGEVEPSEILRLGAYYSQGLHWMLTGLSRNGVNHVVICKGAEIIHDTSIDQSGIVGPTTENVWLVGWLVRHLPYETIEEFPL